MTERIHELIMEKCRKNLLFPDDHLFNDLGLNSLDLAELITDMETEFDVIIPDEKIERLCRVRDVQVLFEEVKVAC
jgi:acyl carrier protein